MNNTLTCVLTFSTGAAVGAVVSWKLLKTKYERIAQEEIDSVKEIFAKKADDECDEPETEKEEYTSILESEGYDYPNTTEKEGGSKSVDVERPYVISPDEFAEYDDYKTTSLTYYEGDEVLVDDHDNVIDDVDDIVGSDALTNFDDYGSVFVRNDRLRTDYEILLDVRSYESVMGEGLSEDE